MPGYDSWKTRSPDDDLEGIEPPTPEQERDDYEDQMQDDLSVAYWTKAFIDVLREDEGDSVTILCENPDGPNAVECNGHWTNWEDKRFEGETVLDALAAAHNECIQLRAAISAGQKWWFGPDATP